MLTMSTMLRSQTVSSSSLSMRKELSSYSGSLPKMFQKVPIMQAIFGGMWEARSTEILRDHLCRSRTVSCGEYGQNSYSYLLFS